MNRTALLTAASVIALCAGNSWAGMPAGSFGTVTQFPITDRAKILYNQNSNNESSYILSSEFTCGSYTFAYSAYGADDFVIPKGRTWTVKQVDVTGQFFNGSGPATNLNVTFYKDGHGKPGNPVKNGTFTGLATTGQPNFTTTLPGKGLRLRAGRYWLSVFPDMDFVASVGEWGWELNSVQHGKAAMWENPGDGFGTGCTTWDTLQNCLARTGDLMFDLKGTETHK